MNIFVGNLSFEANGGDVKKLFEGFGNVASVVIVMSREKKTPKPRGFGFVQIPDEQQALAAIAALNGKEFMGRVLDINPARPKAKAQAENELKEKGRGKHKPWMKSAGDAKPWKKSSERPQKSRFSPSVSSFDELRANPKRSRIYSLRIVRGNGERSLT
ncbi:MAG: hypothetical protein WC628_06200 [Candidatus Omnitrophota bacterium]